MLYFSMRKALREKEREREEQKSAETAKARPINAESPETERELL